jgi:hypothetical protein
MAKLVIEVEDGELMSGVFDNLWESSSPWVGSTNWDWQATPIQTVVEVTYDSPDDDEGTFGGKATVTVEDLAKAYSQILRDNKHHCGEPVTTEIDEWDSCVSDYVLQYALFGKLIYG